MEQNETHLNEELVSLNQKFHLKLNMLSCEATETSLVMTKGFLSPPMLTLLFLPSSEHHHQPGAAYSFYIWTADKLRDEKSWIELFSVSIVVDFRLPFRKTFFISRGRSWTFVAQKRSSSRAVMRTSYRKETVDLQRSELIHLVPESPFHWKM